jgi:hypothetical protein
MNRTAPSAVVLSNCHEPLRASGAFFVLIALVGGIVSSPALGSPSFSDQTNDANLTGSSESYGASFGDLNGDGYLEIYTSNHRMQDALYLNMRNRTFYKIASQVLTWRNHKNADTHGGTFADIDNDGDQDLLISTGTGNPEELLYNENQRLVDRTAEKGLTTLDLGGRQPVWLDYDHDKLLDFVMTQLDGAATLYHQGADGNFTDLTSTAKFVCTNFHYGELFDANDDGTLDFICPDQDVYPQRIYDTTTMPWTKIFEAKNANHTWFPRVPGVVDSVMADFDNDGREDIFLLSNAQLHPSSVAQSSPTHFESLLAGGTKGFKFVSGGRITITLDWNNAEEQSTADLTKIQIGANAVHPSSINFTLDPADPNVAGMPTPPNDQTTFPVMQIGYNTSTQQWTLVLQTRLLETDPSVFSVAYLQVDSTSEITGLTGTGFWPGDLPARPTLLMNRPGSPPSYVDETASAGLDTPIQCVSATAGDFDNDMDIDLYLACRTGASNIENILYENLGNGTFQQVSNAGGAPGPVGVAVASGAGTADSAISGDYDVDGFLDLFVTNGLNLQPREFGGPNQLFHNEGNSNHWVEVDLVGTNSDRDATGAKVYATAGGVTQLRVQNGAYHRWSQDAKRAHFGLAGNTTVDLRVEWPSGNVETFSVAANSLYRITENTGIATVDLGAAPKAYQCGSPTLNGAVDSGVFVWRDCATGQWSMRVMSANTAITYQGTITSSTSNFTSSRPRALEPNDVLDTSNPKQIGFTLNSTGTGFDGMDFDLPDGADACLQIAAPSGAQLFMGPFKTPISAPANLETQDPCTSANGNVGFEVSAATIDESAGSVTLTVVRSGSASGAVSVDYSTSSGSATADSDFTSASGTLTWADGDAANKTITVDITNDSTDESDETFTVTLSNPSGGAFLGSSSQTTVTVVDDDSPAAPPPPPSSGGSSGGGGAMGLLSLLLLGIARLVRLPRHVVRLHWIPTVRGLIRRGVSTETTG